MDKDNVISIITSIVPRNIEHQQSAIASWQALGFNVISINSALEINAVRSRFQTVNFVLADRTAESETGKQYIYFDDVCRAIALTNADICGIINSDIHLLQDACLKDFIAREAKNSFIFGSRIDVDLSGNTDGEIFFFGFDFFFFDRIVLDCYPLSDFCLGAPWWDYWAPSVPLAKGIPCKELISPVAFHLKHETKWAPDLFFRFGNIFAEEFQKLSASIALDRKLVEGIEDVFACKDFNVFSHIVLQYILDKSKQISLEAQDPLNNKVIVGMMHYVSMRRQVIAKSQECWRLSSENSQLKYMVEQGNYIIQALQSSLFWRLTAPLRKMLDVVRKKT